MTGYAPRFSPGNSIQRCASSYMRIQAGFVFAVGITTSFAKYRFPRAASIRYRPLARNCHETRGVSFADANDLACARRLTDRELGHV